MLPAAAIAQRYRFYSSIISYAAFRRSARTFITCKVNSGTCRNRESKLGWSITATTQSVRAVTVAQRASELIAAISPTISPGPAVAMTFSLREIVPLPYMTT